MDKLISLDKELLVYLNNLGSKQWDSFWLHATNQFHWIPLFVFLLVLLFYKFQWKNTLLLLLFVAIIVAFSDQFTNLVKYTFERVRPCNDSSLEGLLRQFTYKPGGYSYYSGHAALSSTVTVFIILLLRKHFKSIYLLILFPIIFGYSRIYLGVHYPLDIFSGYVVGALFGVLFFKIQKKFRISTRF